MDLKKLGVTEKEVLESANIKETFKFEDLSFGDRVLFKFVDGEILEIDYKAKVPNKERGISIGDIVKVPAIKVYFVKQYNSNGEVVIENEITDDNIYTLWLSSKTLSMGIAKISLDNKNGVKGLNFEVKKDKATFKTGENTCYRVKEIKEV